MKWNLFFPTVAIFLIITLLLGCSFLEDLGKLISFKKEKHWELIWSDEFNGDSINLSNWNFDVGGNGWGNKELQYYTKGSNVRVSNGNLIIEARNEKFGIHDYTSARIKTQGKHSWQYGKIEARIKLPYGQGLWPAFWMLGENIETVGHPDCGEIDIMEMVGSNEGEENATIWSSLHWADHEKEGSNKTKSLKYSFKNSDGDWFSDDYHIFGIQWSADYIQYYVDNHVFKTVTLSTRKNDGQEAFRKPFFIILNLAVGGEWPNSPDKGTDWPQQMVVDWVRVYQSRSDGNAK
ncbi:MAG: glycoside hydrolase family 16 protein [Syntrophaceae bacterium]|nr:glycoside hydrolase family 16 protein [Syntrophaceae bacterium]